jgi:hypothetical protein
MTKAETGNPCLAYSIQAVGTKILHVVGVRADEMFMSSVIEKQVKAFGDAVMDAHREAMHYWTVQELAIAGPNVVQMFKGIIERHRAEGPFDAGAAQDLIGLCRVMLQAMGELLDMMRDCKARGFDITGTAECGDAMLEIRELLASLVEPSTSTKQIAPSGNSIDEFAAASKELPPKQSWFEEDVRGLRGPSSK